MKNLFYVLFLFSLCACQNEQVDSSPIQISGKYENLKKPSITLSALDFEKEIKLNADGTFNESIQLPHNGYYTIQADRARGDVYLKNGSDLGVSGDITDPTKTSFTGALANENNLLKSIAEKSRALMGNPPAFFNKPEDAFIESAKNIKSELDLLVNSAKDIDKGFKKEQLQNNHYGYLDQLSNYEPAYAYYSKTEGFKASDNLKGLIGTIDLNNKEAYLSSPKYKNLIFSAMQKKMGEVYEETTNYSKALKASADQITNKFIKSEMLKDYAAMLLGPNEDLQSNYDYLMANTDTEKYRTDYTDTYNRLKKLAKGQPSPQFVNYENHKGGETSLSDLKGKYVYVDVWATWCGPCKKEIPSLQAVEKEFHGKNIEFVSTSIDRAKDHEAWVNMVKDKNLGGIQLMADNDWKSKFVTDYEITGIPRFILIDPEGNIVSADAPRPSDPKLKEMLNELEM